MSSRYMRVKQSPWRYIGAAVAFFGLVVFLATLHTSASGPQYAYPTITNTTIDLLDDIFNTTLGVCLA